MPAYAPKENFLDFFDTELQNLAGDFAEGAKNVSEILLQTEDLKKTQIPEQKELKKSLQAFLTDYPHAKRFGTYQPLLMTFINLMNPEYNNQTEGNQEINIKFQQLLKENFAIVLKDYEENYKKFIKNKFLIKLEDFKRQLSSEELKDMPDLNEMVEKLKNCTSYQCLPTNLDSLLMALKCTSKDSLYKYFEADLKRGLTFALIRQNNVLKTFMKDNTKISQLEGDCRKNLTNFTNEFITLFENSREIVKILELNKEKINFEEKLKNDLEFCSKDRKFLQDYFINYEANEFRYELERNEVVEELTSKIAILALASAFAKIFEVFG